MTHPTLEELVEICLAHTRGEKGPAAAEKHLSANCSLCEDRLQEIDRVVHAMATDRVPDPPASWVERAIAVFARPSLASQLAEFGRGLAEEAGRLIFSSWSPDLPAFAGARGSSTIQRLRFEADGVELDLQIERTGRGGNLLGQLLLRRFAHGFAHALGGDQGP